MHAHVRMCVCVCIIMYVFVYVCTYIFRNVCSAGRDYDLVLHEDKSMDEVFTGEPHKMHSYKNQKK